MKKIFSILCFLFLFMTFTNVNAANFSTYLSGNKSINENGTVTITVGVKNASNLWGFRAPINYDSSKLTLTKSTGLNGFGVAVGTNFVADNSKGINGSSKVATLVFKATPNFKVGDSATISLGQAEGSDGENLMTGNGSSITIKVVPPKSTNNNLKSLSIEGQTIDFSKDKTNYSITVDHSVSKIKINGSSEDEKAKVTGLGEKELNLYSNTFDIVVQAENGEQKTYTVEVIRKDVDGNVKELSKDNNLSKLEVTGYQIPFNSEILEYTILLNDTKDLEIIAESSDSNATVTVNNLDEYKVGNNVIEILVVSENGEQKTYKINAVLLDSSKVSEKSNPLPLAIIGIETAVIVGAFVYGIILNKKGRLVITK